MLKAFHETLWTAKPTIGGLQQALFTAGNPDGEALLAAWHRLRVRPEKRKVLIGAERRQADVEPRATRSGR